MDGISIWHWLIFILLLAVVVVPFWKIFPRAGMSRWWSLLMVVTPINLLLVWVLAFKVWPTDREY
jgi:hypothetical protein